MPSVSPSMNPTPRRIHSGSGSDSGSDSSDEAMSFFSAAQEEVNEKDALLRDAGDAKDASEHELELHFSESVWTNIWLIFGAFLLVNCLCFVLYFKKVKTNHF